MPDHTETIVLITIWALACGVIALAAVQFCLRDCLRQWCVVDTTFPPAYSENVEMPQAVASTNRTTVESYEIGGVDDNVRNML